MQNKYIKYQVPYGSIYELLRKLKKKQIRFFVDFQSISKGLYNRNNVFFELKYYVDNKKPSEALIEEYRAFLNNLYVRFKQYSPFFVTFYDDGKNEQNAILNAGYKSGRSSISDILYDDQELQLYYHIKSLYFTKIEDRFTKETFGKVYYLKEYESDLIPYYCISNNLFESQENDILNIILSLDKDLLQCCMYRNTIQCTNRFFPSKTGAKRLAIELFDDNNAISYIYSKFKPGRLTAKHIPLILAIAGDKADKIDGVKGYGPAKTISLIENFNIPCTKWELQRDHHEGKLPPIISNNLKMIINNLKMISFEEQVKRIKMKLNKEAF